uniref:Polyprotein n=1 Tax=Nigrospora oryzae hypovirus 1 TaxID=2851969 RepID=A0A915Y4Y4_9VIRU|nr:polyprotein [Nigrospora oryzae hypovirus 1]
MNGNTTGNQGPGHVITGGDIEPFSDPVFYPRYNGCGVCEETDGFCYLHVVKPEGRQVAVDELAFKPNLGQVKSFLERHPEYLSPGNVKVTCTMRALPRGVLRPKEIHIEEGEDVSCSVFLSNNQFLEAIVGDKKALQYGQLRRFSTYQVGSPFPPTGCGRKTPMSVRSSFAPSKKTRLGSGPVSYVSVCQRGLGNFGLSADTFECNTMPVLEPDVALAKVQPRQPRASKARVTYTRDAQLSKVQDLLSFRPSPVTPDFRIGSFVARPSFLEGKAAARDIIFGIRNRLEEKQRKVRLFPQPDKIPPFGSPSRFSVLPVVGNTFNSKWERPTQSSPTRKERLPKFKDLNFARWMDHRMEVKRNLHLLALERKKTNLSRSIRETADGPKLFVGSRRASVRLPNSILAVQQVLAKWFGPMSSACSDEDFNLRVKIFGYHIECPLKGYRVQRLDTGYSLHPIDVPGIGFLSEAGLVHFPPDLTFMSVQHLDVQRRFWRAAAKSLLIKRDPMIASIKTAQKLPKTLVEVVRPSFIWRKLGYKIGVKLPGHTVYSRLSSFSRFEGDPADGNLITLTQFDRFWNLNGNRLALTAKGLSRLFKEKKQSFWRECLADHFGVPTHVMEQKLRVHQVNPGAPDFEVRNERNQPLELYSFFRAYDSTFSDIEKNPGPTDSPTEFDVSLYATAEFVPRMSNQGLRRNTDADALSVHHLTPELINEDQLLTRSRKLNHRRYGSEIITTHRKLIGLDDNGSPLRDVVVTQPTPDDTVPPVQFKLARSSSENDIELNPGPTSAPQQPQVAAESTQAEVDKSKAMSIRSRISNSLRPSRRNSNASRLSDNVSITPSEAPSAKSANVFRSAWHGIKDLNKWSTDSDKRHKAWLYFLGYKPSDDVFGWSPEGQTNPKFLSSNYMSHFTIGRLPQGEWKAEMPVRMIAWDGFRQLQMALDQHNVTDKEYTVKRTPQLASMIDDYLSRKAAQKKVLNGHVMTSLAFFIKTSLNCPTDGNGYAIAIDTNTNQISIHVDELCTNPYTKNRLWLVLNGYEMVHCGVPTIPEHIGQRDPMMDIYQWWLWTINFLWFEFSAIFIPSLMWLLYSRLPFLSRERTLVADSTIRLWKDLADARAQESYNEAVKRYEENLYTEVPCVEYAYSMNEFHGGVSNVRDTMLQENMYPGIPPSLWCHKIAWRTWYIYKLIVQEIEYYRRPSFNTRSNLVRELDREDPDADVDQRLLIATYGSRGDQVPLAYYAQLAGHFGVETDYRVVKDFNGQEMDDLAMGKIKGFVPDFIDLTYVASLGYKKVFVPLVELGSCQGRCYALDPGPNWINPVDFVRNWDFVNWSDTPLAIASYRLAKVFQPTWRIGSLKGANLPRSCDGLTLLESRPNYKTGTIGWLSGSASEELIPADVRKSFARVPNGDHSEIMRNFDLIYMHGGAGSVQTALSAGADVVICDSTIDRNYHTVPRPKDFRQPSVGPFMGWLVASGFNVQAPDIVKVIWLFEYYWSIRFQALCWFVYNFIKANVLLYCFKKYFHVWMATFYTFPPMFWRVMYSSSSLSVISKSVAWLLWRYPLMGLYGLGFGLKPFLLDPALWTGLMQDFSNWCKGSTEVIFEPVSRRGIKFSFPWGHYVLHDKIADKFYEGRFVKGETPTIGGRFKLIHNPDFVPACDAIRIPAPFSFHRLNYLLKQEEPKPYCHNHNCLTLVLSCVARRSVVFTIFLFVLSLMVSMALWPPKILKLILKVTFPGVPYEETRFYTSLGFAAGIEHIPFAPIEEYEEKPAQALTPEEPAGPDLSDPTAFDALTDEIAYMQSLFSKAGITGIDDEDIEEAGMRTLENELKTIQLPVDSLMKVEPIPPYVVHTWGQIVENLHHAMSFIRSNRAIDTFFAWLLSIEANVYNFIFPILEQLSKVLALSNTMGKSYFKKFFEAVCHFMDHVWGLSASKRVKTAWGLTGLHQTGLLGVKAKLAAQIAFSEYIGRNDFESDYNRFCAEAKELARKYKAFPLKNVGGPQRRSVRFKTPLMTDGEAKLLGFQPGEYVTDDDYSKRVESYLNSGASQGADGVFLAAKRPELIARSQHRYEPKHPVLSSDDRMFAREIAEAMFDQYPEVFANAEILPPKAVQNYIKAKYSPGTPFIKPGGFKSRQAMFDAGFDKVMQRKALDFVKTGKYPVQFYHAFVKSQVVDIQKCLSLEEGGKEKDVRTVVSQDLFSYFIDQMAQMERNKRLNWETYGAGIGMPLNQSMEKIFSRMADHQKRRGGRYIIADATAFDSRCKPFLFEVNGCLWDLGYKDHPSGNGKNISSVIRASYEARQNAWIIGVTEPEYDSLTVAVPDSETARRLQRANSKKTVLLESLVNRDDVQKLPLNEQIKLIGKLIVPEGKTIISWDPRLRPHRSNWMGSFEFGDIDQAEESFFQFQTFIYDKSNFEAMSADVKAIAHSNYALTSNIHPKNSGGSTGGSDTSNVNTHAFKAGVIYAWCKTTGRAPKEFFKYNDLANTSDDTIWQSGGEFGLNSVEDVYTFQQHCLEVGITLTIDTSKSLSDVEYLSKFVRTPTPEDSAALKSWRSLKIAAINHAQKQRGLQPIDESKLSAYNHPRFVVVQNPKALLLRRGAFRYYQANAKQWRYTAIERGAGHANNTAFVPELYAQFAKEWCDDVNTLMRQWKIPRRYELRNGKFDLMEVVNIDPRPLSGLNERQLAFLKWLKGNMFPSYYRVIDTHMNVAEIDPEQHSKFLKKLEKGWRGWEELLREGVDFLYDCTDAIPDSWSKKFQPSVEMLYAEQPFHTHNKIVERFVYKKMLEEHTEQEISFSDFSLRLQESPYAGCCDIYHFWEKLQDPEYKQSLLDEDVRVVQGLLCCMSFIYMCTSWLEAFILSIPGIGLLYKLWLWSFIGLNKVYGLLNTMYWHATGKSSREISRIQPKDPYIMSKQFAAFLVDLLPEIAGWIMLVPVEILTVLPPMLESIGKTWYVGGQLKIVPKANTHVENPWASYADEYIDKLRESKTRRAYIAARTSTGKSTMFIAALWGARHRKGIDKIWLVEPRKVLRDETIIPFDIPTQRLKRGVQPSKYKADVYICTYGHFLGKVDQVGDNDIVLFDEFHEEQGEMILGLTAFKTRYMFLLSATPLNIPSLKGSPFLTPNIDRRFPIKIHKVDDGTNVIDMFLEAQNRYPEECKRTLVIVPTHKEVRKTIEALNYLKVGLVSPLTSRDKKVPETGIIVATPYVQTGLDIKPPCDVLIDCGTDIVFDKGKFIKPFPWTDADINKQRQGRVGRTKAGIVFQPESAGTGAKAVNYPTPQLFRHETVAKHFKVDQLTPMANPVCSDLPFMRLNKTILRDIQIQKSVTLVHTFALAGIRQTDWQQFYGRYQRLIRGGEDYQIVDNVFDHVRWSHVPLLEWDVVMYHLHERNAVEYSIANKTRFSLPIYPINGTWQEVEVSPNAQIDVEKYSITKKSKYVGLSKEFEKLKSSYLDHALTHGEDAFQKALTTLL